MVDRSIAREIRFKCGAAVEVYVTRGTVRMVTRCDGDGSITFRR